MKKIIILVLITSMLLSLSTYAESTKQPSETSTIAPTNTSLPSETPPNIENPKDFGKFMEEKIKEENKDQDWIDSIKAFFSEDTETTKALDKFNDLSSENKKIFIENLNSEQVYKEFLSAKESKTINKYVKVKVTKESSSSGGSVMPVGLIASSDIIKDWYANSLTFFGITILRMKCWVQYRSDGSKATEILGGNALTEVNYSVNIINYRLPTRYINGSYANCDVDFTYELGIPSVGTITYQSGNIWVQSKPGDCRGMVKYN